MISIAVSSQKGGVGKTTLSINLAYSFARAGVSTLLVDADPQGSVGHSLTRQSRSFAGFYDFLSNPAMDPDPLIIPTRLKTFSLMPSGSGSDYDSGGAGTGVYLARCRAFLRAVAAKGFDLCLIDTAAGLFGVSGDVIAATTGVLVPQQSEPLGIRSVPKLLEGFGKLRISNPRLNLLGVCLTMVQEDLPESVQAGTNLRELLPPELVFKTEIPRASLFVTASARGLPVGVLPEGEQILGRFDELRVEIEDKLRAR